MIELIKPCLIEHEILIEKIKNSNFGIKLRNKDIKYLVNYEKLVEVYVDKFMMQQPFKVGMNYLFTISDLILENQNIRNFLDTLLYSDSQRKYQYMINKNDYIGVVEIRKDQNYSMQDVHVVPLKWVIDRFKDLMFTNIISKEILNFFTARGYKISFENFKDFDEEDQKKMHNIRLQKK